jgi:putative acetyltransferase
MIIRDERPEDREAVARIVGAAFGRPDEAELVERLRGDGDAALPLVACEDDGVIGHVLLSPMRAPFRALGLAPLSVSPERQRSGVGTALTKAGLQRAAADGWEAVFVLGDPAYYRRFGFSVERAAGFASPYAGPYLMVLALAGSLSASEGAIGHAPALHA